MLPARHDDDDMNSIQPSIQFAMEKEQDNKLTFIKVLVTCTAQGFGSCG